MTTGVKQKRTDVARAALRQVDPGRAAADVFDLFAGDPYPFFLDSGLVMEDIGRYSFIGSRPFLVLMAKGRRVEIRRPRAAERSGPNLRLRENPFQTLKRLLARFRVEGDPRVPFVGGAVGFLGYDLCHFIERLPCTTVDDIRFPDMYFAFYDRAIAFDHHLHKCYLAAVPWGEETSVQAKMDELEARLSTRQSPARRAPLATRAGGPVRSNFTKDDYLRVVQRTKDYIAAGDIFQANISQRFHTRLNVTPCQLYRRLRALNPAPFAAYLQFDDKAVVSSSPERFLRVRDRHVQTRPIKGTRPRGRDPVTDRGMRRELLASEKDAAELTMIVDLERNDLGRVCKYGTVRVAEHKTLEAYATVYHLVSTVVGELHPRYDLVDLLKATFPGGSITGAPKIRSMEIIDELEPTQRSVYTGAIGYVGFDGSMDLNIVIRTFLINGRDAYFQVGGGIVADSQPEAEYDETLDKARALIEAVTQTEGPASPPNQ